MMHKHGEKSKGTSWFGGSKKKQETSEEIKHKAAEFEAYMSSFKKCRKRVQENLHMVKAGSFSWDSIKEFTNSFRDIDGVLVEYILNLKVDILDSKAVRDLVDVYFRVSLQTLELLNELENCLRVAGNDQLRLRLAGKKFLNKKYAETLEKVEKFEAKGDPFKEKFWVLYVELCQQQISSLNKVMDLHVLLNKPPPPKPKPEEYQEADGDDEPMEATENDNTEETDVAIDEPVQDADDVVDPMKEPEWNCVIVEYENYRALALTLTEKITSLSADHTAIDDDEAKLVVDNLNTEIDKFTDDIANMTDHTRKCRNDILSDRDKVSGSIKTSV